MTTQQVTVKTQVRELIAQDYHYIKTPLTFSEIENLWKYYYHQAVDPAELYAALDNLQLDGELIYAVLPDGRIVHAPVEAEDWLRTIGAQYWTAQRGKVRA